MSGCGIICEFNPLHNGHIRIINEARSRGERVICVMSGNAVQRGELAVTDKYARAKAAILCGADLVLELPYPWCAASAEHFARAAVYILSGFCNNVIFGSESGDISTLKRCADVALGESFRDEYKKRLESGEGAAEAYFEMLGRECGNTLLSNDLLGIEYMRTASLLSLPLEFHTVRREGAAYNDRALVADVCPSATAIRRCIGNGEIEICRDYMPRAAYDVLKEEYDSGRISDMNTLDKAVIMYFRLREGRDFENIAFADGGIANRICSLARSAVSYDELLDKLKTKRYTDAKLRRAVLYCLTGVERQLLEKTPEYTVLLGANAKGREILAKARKDGGVRVITKPADAPRESEQYKAGERLEAVFSLALRSSTEAEAYLRKSAFII